MLIIFFKLETIEKQIYIKSTQTTKKNNNFSKVDIKIDDWPNMDFISSIFIAYSEDGGVNEFINAKCGKILIHQLNKKVKNLHRPHKTAKIYKSLNNASHKSCKNFIPTFTKLKKSSKFLG